MEGWQQSTRRPPRPKYNDFGDVDKHRDDNDGDDDDDHCGAVETNAGESDGADEYGESPAFALEAIRQFNANVVCVPSDDGG